MGQVSLTTCDRDTWAHSVNDSAVSSGFPVASTSDMRRLSGKQLVRAASCLLWHHWFVTVVVNALTFGWSEKK